MRIPDARLGRQMVGGSVLRRGRELQGERGMICCIVLMSNWHAELPRSFQQKMLLVALQVGFSRLVLG